MMFIPRPLLGIVARHRRRQQPPRRARPLLELELLESRDLFSATPLGGAVPLDQLASLASDALGTAVVQSTIHPGTQGGSAAVVHSGTGQPNHGQVQPILPNQGGTGVGGSGGGKEHIEGQLPPGQTSDNGVNSQVGMPPPSSPDEAGAVPWAPRTPGDDSATRQMAYDPIPSAPPSSTTEQPVVEPVTNLGGDAGLGVATGAGEAANVVLPQPVASTPTVNAATPTVSGTAPEVPLLVLQAGNLALSEPSILAGAVQQGGASQVPLIDFNPSPALPVIGAAAGLQQGSGKTPGPQLPSKGSGIGLDAPAELQKLYLGAPEATPGAQGTTPAPNLPGVPHGAGGGGGARVSGQQAAPTGMPPVLVSDKGLSLSPGSGPQPPANFVGWDRSVWSDWRPANGAVDHPGETTGGPPPAAGQGGR
jgi:hypothetical protein